MNVTGSVAGSGHLTWLWLLVAAAVVLWAAKTVFRRR
jgi:hypothetical protein